MSFAAIESANVVGYTGTELANAGAKPMGASFVNVGTEPMTIAALSVSGYDPEDGYADFSVYFQKLGPSGKTLGTDYYWCDFEEEGETYRGWFDGDMNDLNDTPLKPGEGLWMYANDNSLSLVSAGAVPGADVSYTLPSAGAKMIVNPQPVVLTLDQVFVSGYDPEDGYADFSVYFQKLGPSGKTLGTDYYWCDFEEEGETYVGWFDGDMNDLNDKTLGIGEGVWMYSNDSTLSVVFPSPLVK